MICRRLTGVEEASNQFNERPKELSLQQYVQAYLARYGICQIKQEGPEVWATGETVRTWLAPRFSLIVKSHPVPRYRRWRAQFLQQPA